MEGKSDEVKSYDQADIDASLYYKTLCSSGLGFINKQHGQIEQKRTHLVESKQKLVYNNYDSIIKFSSFSKDLIHDFQKIETSLESLKKTIPTFKTKCEEFSQDARKISVRWKDVSSMLAKYPQMIEFLEIPQLLNNCIRTFYYDDALKICNFITRFCTRYRSMAPIFENMLAEIDKSKDIMIAQILKEMNTNVQLPVCMKLIDYLRQTDRFTEEQLRVNFLLARDVWFQAAINKNTAVVNSFTYISSITEVFRINIFDIVTQYRAIFPDIDSIEGQKKGLAMAGRAGNEYHNHKIINSWLLFKIEHYLRMLRTSLDASLQQASILPLDTVIDHCFYFGLSMSKIGADIRPQLILIFNQFIASRFQLRVEEANRKFEKSIGDIFKTVKRQSSAQQQQEGGTFEATLEQFPLVLAYHNDICATFSEIRNNVPLCLFASFTAVLNASFQQIVKNTTDYIRNHEYSLNTDEFQYYLRLCSAVQNALFPTLSRHFQQLCPISAISQRLAVTTSELLLMASSNSSNKVEGTAPRCGFELDIKTPIDELGAVIKEISKSKSLQ